MGTTLASIVHASLIIKGQDTTRMLLAALVEARFTSFIPSSRAVCLPPRNSGLRCADSVQHPRRRERFLPPQADALPPQLPARRVTRRRVLPVDAARPARVRAEPRGALAL